MTSPQRLPITVFVAAKNEEANIGRCLAALDRANRVLVIDSHSSDETASIARAHGAEVVQFEFRGGYPRKRQWALDTIPVADPWVLLVDADEVVPEALWDEIAEAVTRPDAPDAFLVTKGFHFLGRRFRFGGFSHAAVLLFRRGRARFERLADDDRSGHDMEVHERLIVAGSVGRLRTPLIHEDFKGLDAYRDRHRKYAEWEAGVRHRYLMTGAYGESAIEARLFGNAQERRRFLKGIAVRLPFEPAAWFTYHYLLRLGFLEGRAGYVASRIRAGYIADVRARVRELRKNGKRSIVLLNRFYWPDVTATAQMLTDLAEDLARSGWNTTVVTSDADYSSGRTSRPRNEVHNGVRIVRIRGTAMGRHRVAARVADAMSYMLGASLKLLTLPRMSVVVAMSDPPLLVTIATLAARIRGARVVHWVQDLYPQIAASLGVLRRDGPFYRMIDAVARRANASCDLVVALGPRMRDASIAAGASSERTRVIHNWADASAIVPIEGADNDFVREHDLAGKFVVLYSGNAGRAHTFDALIGAMRRLRDDSRFLFVFIGGGKKSAELRSAVERDGLTNVRFLGYVPRERLSQSLSAAAVSLVTEAPEAMGLLVPSKAYGILASGRPIVFVGSEQSDVAELVSREECGAIVGPNDSEKLTETLVCLCESDQLRAAMGARARRAAETVYDRQIATSRWAEELAAIV